jgi:hypothetical protein
MDQFPQMLYVHPGREALHGSTFDTLVVNSAEDLEAAKAEGWSIGTDEAKAAFAAKQEAAKVAAQPAPAINDAAPATREELEQKAAELGIKFDGRTGDKKLADLIAATLGT